MEPARGPTGKRHWRQAARYGSVGIEMGLCVVFGLLLGWWVGDLAGSPTWGMGIGLVLGFAAALKVLWHLYHTVVADQTAARTKKDQQ